MSDPAADPARDPAAEGVSPYGSPRIDTAPARRTRIHHLQAMKDRGERWPMLTAYDQYAAAVFDEVGIPVLLVGDSAANNVYGYDTTLPVTVEALLPLVRAVSRSTRRALVVAVMAHIGFTPRSEHGLGGYRVQGRGEVADRLVAAGKAMQEAGAFAVVLEMVPAEVAAAVTATLTIPTIGIGAGLLHG